MTGERDTVVVDVPERRRYELRSSGTLAGLVTYRDEPGRRVLQHTEIKPELSGHGLGTSLVTAVLDDIRARGDRVVPVCPFIADFIGRHPQYRDLVAGEADTDE